MSGSLLQVQSVAPGASERHPRSPGAIRVAPPTWRDPRLLVGLGLVCLSVLVGVKVMGAADDTVPVLASRRALATGELIRPDDLTTVHLRFATGSDADRYLSAGGSLPVGAVLLRPVGAGELVPRAAVTGADEPGLVELPLAVDAGRVPASVRPGSTVDVWASAPDRAGPSATGVTTGGAAASTRVLDQAPVVSVSRGPNGPGTVRQVVVGVPVAEEARLARVVAEASATSLLIVRRPG